MTFAADLRHLADVIDTNPDLGLTRGGHILVFLGMRDDPFPDRVRALSNRFGSVDKDRGDGQFSVRCKLNDAFTIVAIDYDREVACERVLVGVETVERPVMEQVGTETVEVPVFEWKCPDSILAPA